MNRSIRLLAMLVIVLSPTDAQPSKSKARRLDFTMTWGLENDGVFREGQKFSPSWLKWKTRPKRFFVFNGGAHHQEADECTNRRMDLWFQYKKEHPNTTKEQFDSFWQVREPRCVITMQRLAPTLFFDFAGKSGSHYVLRTVDVRTFDFSEYRGGGFEAKTSWYDLVIPHIPGVHSFQVERKLEFDATGRAQLRLWSDNYYASNGWVSPMGAYLIDITFHFECDGLENTLSTGPFQIDI